MADRHRDTKAQGDLGDKDPKVRRTDGEQRPAAGGAHAVGDVAQTPGDPPLRVVRDEPEQEPSS
ncbi:hypothetical protein [Catellatospora sp. NPDC049609]|uniref:hypothetical protein n=1 Tax=Catellatospora sp. NPDC049609 TaxID=3155505 RepID=UPI0034246DFD